CSGRRRTSRDVRAGLRSHRLAGRHRRLRLAGLRDLVRGGGVVLDVYDPTLRVEGRLDLLLSVLAAPAPAATSAPLPPEATPAAAFTRLAVLALLRLRLLRES